jgi:hypothetical protein
MEGCLPARARAPHGDTLMWRRCPNAGAEIEPSKARGPRTMVVPEIWTRCQIGKVDQKKEDGTHPIKWKIAQKRRWDPPY